MLAAPGAFGRPALAKKAVVSISASKSSTTTMPERAKAVFREHLDILVAVEIGDPHAAARMIQIIRWDERRERETVNDDV